LASLVFPCRKSGAVTAAPTCSLYQLGQKPRRIDDLGAISDHLRNPDAFVWLDAVAPRATDLALIQTEFGLHPLAVEDAVVAHQRPKIEAYTDSWFLIVHGVSRADGELTFHEVAIFAGANFIVTVRAQPPYPLEEVHRRWEQQHNGMQHDSAGLLHTILDTIVDGYTPIADSFENHVEVLEARLLEGATQRADEVLLEILGMKNDLTHFRRAVFPMRDILTPIMRGDRHLFAAEDLPYYRDVQDHVARVLDQLDAARDLINNARDTHIAMVTNRQQEAAKQLTLVATIFLPLTFITGFFGQNFGWLVNNIANSQAFFWLGIGTELLALLLLVAFFRYKGWS
jgi:magnesium transporter